jgi:hypothetical protein
LVVTAKTQPATWKAQLGGDAKGRVDGGVHLAVGANPVDEVGERGGSCSSLASSLRTWCSCSIRRSGSDEEFSAARMANAARLRGGSGSQNVSSIFRRHLQFQRMREACHDDDDGDYDGDDDGDFFVLGQRAVRGPQRTLVDGVRTGQG